MGIRWPAASPTARPIGNLRLPSSTLLWADIPRGGQVGGTYTAPAQVIDLSGYSNHLANHQALSEPLGLVFDAVDDRLSMGTNILNNQLTGAGGISAAIKVRPLELAEDNSRNHLFNISQNGSSSCIAAWFTDSGKLAFGGRSQAGDSFQSYSSAEAVAEDGEELFLCGVLDFASDIISVWLNGEYIARQQASFLSDTYQPGTATIADTLGASASGLHPLAGIVSGFAVFGKPLYESEIEHVRWLME